MRIKHQRRRTGIVGKSDGMSRFVGGDADEVCFVADAPASSWAGIEYDITVE
jgi:hypothetical protein